MDLFTRGQAAHFTGGVQKCKIFLHLFEFYPVLVLWALLCGSIGHAATTDLSIYSADVYDGQVSSDLPSDDSFTPVPLPEHWLNRIFRPDKTGVMNSMANEVQRWQTHEEFLDRWGFTHSSIHTPIERETKMLYLRQQGLRYLDRRLSEEMKRARPGSTLSDVGRVKESVESGGKVKVARNVNFRVRPKVFQGELSMMMTSPYVNLGADVKVNGRVKLHSERELKMLGVRADVDYHLQDEIMVTSLNRSITPRLEGKISDAKILGRNRYNSDRVNEQRVEFFYTTPF